MPSGPTGRPRTRPHRRVHVRFVWSGLAVALVGSLVLGVGIGMLSWPVSLVGAALTALGAAISVLGGALLDARPEFSVVEEIREVEHGRVQRGVVPGQMIDDRRAGADATRTSETVRAVQAARRDYARSKRWIRGRALARPAGATLMVVTLGMYVLVGSLVTSTPTGHTVALEDMGLSIVLAIAGFRLLTVPGLHPFAAGTALVAGVLLVLQGLLGTHGDSALGPIEATCGFLAVAAALTAWLSRAPSEAEAAHPGRNHHRTTHLEG